MIKLSGILEYSMGGFLCLRGFASYEDMVNGKLSEARFQMLADDYE